MRRTHVAALYEWREGADEDAYGKAVAGWVQVADGVVLNLQPQTSSVQQAAAGRQIETSYRAFGPGRVPFAVDQGLVLTATLPAGHPYYGPTVFRVRMVGQHGGRWDTVLMLDDTNERIP